MKIEKHLGLAPSIDGFKQSFLDNYKDKRRETSRSYSARDTALSGLACMFYKLGNMVNFQERVKQKHHRNNLQTQ